MEPLKYPSAVIANWFLEKDPKMKDDVMKVLKLVYIAHGFHLAFKDTPLIKEDVQAGLRLKRWALLLIIEEIGKDLKKILKSKTY